MARIYANWKDAYGEIKRDVSENGISVHTKTYQNKDIEKNPMFETKEIQNYSWVLQNAKSSDITGVTQPWADAEFLERIAPEDMNPGEAWKLRADVWTEFLMDGKQSYTYNERYHRNKQLDKIIQCLKNDPMTRQAWLSMWDPNEDPDKFTGVGRCPCTLGYHFFYRGGKLNMHNVMRSCDIYTHFCNDVYLSIRLLEYVAEKVSMPVGNFQQTVFSLHAYRKDFEDTIF